METKNNILNFKPKPKKLTQSLTFDLLKTSAIFNRAWQNLHRLEKILIKKRVSLKQVDLLQAGIISGKLSKKEIELILKGEIYE